MTQDTLQRAARWLLYFTVAVFALYLVIYVVYAAALFRFPYDYDQGEGFELNDSLLFLQGQWPYRSNEVFPFYASNYPPLFHWIVLPLFALFGPTLAAGRVLSFTVTLLIAFLVGWVVYSKTRDRPIAAISGLMVLASNFIYHVGPLYRQHMTMVLFELLAVILISRCDDPKRGRWYIVLSMLALLAAGYTKQLSAATAAAVMFFLFLRSPGKAIIAGFGLAIVAGGIFLLIDTATQHQWFINTITANANAYDYRQALDLYRQFFTLHFFTVALAIGYSFYQLYWDRLSAYTIWFGFMLVNSALAGKWGAGESYFATAIVASCILSGFAVVKLLRWAKHPSTPTPLRCGGYSARRAHAPREQNTAESKHARRSAQDAVRIIVSFAIPLLYLAQAYSMRHLPTAGPIFGPLADLVGVGRGASVYAGYPYYDSIGYTQVGHLPTDEDAAAGDRIASLIKATGRPALTEEAMLALRADQPVVTNPTQLLNLWNNHALDPTELIASIDRQDYGLVVLRAQFYPPPALQAIGARYKPIDDIVMNGFQYRILAPRQDYGAGCDEARFYGLISQLNASAPHGAFRVIDRNTTPIGWAGPAGVSELEYRAGDQPASRGPAYRLWIAPLNWQGQSPPDGSGAARLGQNACFQFFDKIRDTDLTWPTARDDVMKTLGIKP